MTRYNEVVGFIEANHQNLSKPTPVEKLLVYFLKRSLKLMNAGGYWSLLLVIRTMRQQNQVP